MRRGSALFSLKIEGGLNLQWDPLDAPLGSLLRAENLIHRREGLIGEARRGLSRYGAAAAAQIDQIHEYRDRLIRHHGSTLEYDADGAGNWTAYTGSFAAPESGARLRALEARKNLYTLTSLGTYKQDSLTADPVPGGMPQGLDIRLGTTGTGLGPLLADSQVGYLVIWGRVDRNERLLLGAPSFSEVIANPYQEATYTSSGSTITVTLNGHGFSNGDAVVVANTDDDANLAGTFTITNVTTNTFDYTATAAPSPTSGNLEVTKDYDVTVDFPLPDDIVEDDFVELYRTHASASASSPPSSEHFKITRRAISAADVSAGSISYTDDLPKDFLGERAYTNPSQGRISRKNDRPPWARDLCRYKGHVIYANTKREQEIEIQLRSVSGLTDGTSSITIGAETYVFDTAENLGTKHFERHTGFSTDAENIEETAKSLIYVINRSSGAYYAWYSSLETDPPGKILIRHRLLNQSAYALTANDTTTGGVFEPVLPTSGTSVSSASPGETNELAISKFEQPEAVPRFSTLPVGSEDDEILRVLPLRDSVIVFLRDGGVFVLTGETDSSVGSSFIVKERDPSLRLQGAETARVLDNAVYCHSTKGFARVDEHGTEIVGRPIEEEIRKIASFSTFEALSHAVAYESDHLYVCFTPELSTDTTTATVGWCYNALTHKWTMGWRKKVSAGHVLSTDKRIYLAHGVDHFVLQERKAYGDTDYQDEDIATTVTVVDTVVNAEGVEVSLLTITYTYTGADISDGFLFTQGLEFSSVAKVTDLGGGSFQIELQELLADVTTGAATLTIPIYVNLQTTDLEGSDAAILKAWQEVHIEFEEDSAFSHYVGFASDFLPDEILNEDPYEVGGTGIGWGESSWGESEWGDAGERSQTPLIVTPPASFCKARRLRVGYQHHVAGEKVAISQIAIKGREIGTRSARKVPR